MGQSLAVLAERNEFIRLNIELDGHRVFNAYKVPADNAVALGLYRSVESVQELVFKLSVHLAKECIFLLAVLKYLVN